MTPEMKVRYLVLAKAGEWDEKFKPDFNAPEGFEALWEAMTEDDAHWDAISEVRGGEVETSLPCDRSRHYESKAVAAKLPDGSWVGWTYWYGGGKHGEPEAIDWMDSAYDLTCTEEEKVVTVRTFEKGN
jgi:hypothetical protein